MHVLAIAQSSIIDTFGVPQQTSAPVYSDVSADMLPGIGIRRKSGWGTHGRQEEEEEEELTQIVPDLSSWEQQKLSKRGKAYLLFNKRSAKAGETNRT